MQYTIRKYFFASPC